jgi:inosine-uridine nucleoside N-ribohydrolase
MQGQGRFASRGFWFDPEAAKSVLEAPWKKIVCTPVDISVKNENHG